MVAVVEVVANPCSAPQYLESSVVAVWVEVALGSQAVEIVLVCEQVQSGEVKMTSFLLHPKKQIPKGKLHHRRRCLPRYAFLVLLPW